MKPSLNDKFMDLSRQGKFYELATDPEFWTFMCPRFNITADGKVEPWESFELDSDELDYIKTTLRKDGYFTIPAILDESEMQWLSEAVVKMHKNQWPTVYCMVYDEFWQIFQRASWVLTRLLGADYKVIPSFWVYYINNTDNESGWAPHRDRAGVNQLMPDGMPVSLTVWIALNDANPQNGCMYLLPASRDHNYPDNLYSQDVRSLQDIRALPAPAGSVLSWNEMVFHWGARSSMEASHPRMSVALGFQRAEFTPRETPLLDPWVLPTFNERLSLIGQHFFRFGFHMNLPTQTMELAERLCELGEPIQVWDKTPYPGDEAYKKSIEDGTIKPMYGPSALAHNGPDLATPSSSKKISRLQTANYNSLRRNQQTWKKISK